MSKIMCDVCGTVFQDTTGNCPICGWIPPRFREKEEQANDDFVFEDFPMTGKPTKAQMHSDGESRVKLLFSDFQEMMGKLRREDGAVQSAASDIAGQFNSPLVISLVVVIVLLLLSTGYLFFRYYLPNRPGKAPETAPTVIYDTEPTTEEITTVPNVPCTGLVLTSGTAELSSKGQFFMIHVRVMPEDSTDAVSFISEDNSVATVSSDGKVTAVGEGETTIVITCGSQLIRSKVIVDYSAEATEVPATLVTIVPAETEAPAGTEEPEKTEIPAETEEPEATTPAETKPGIKLRLKRHDVSTNKGYNIQLLLDCNLTAEEVTWTSDNPNIARVDKEGRVYALASGNVYITITYGDQTDKCIVRVR